MRDKVYYVGALLSLIALCCNYSSISITLLVVGFLMTLVGYVK